MLLSKLLLTFLVALALVVVLTKLTIVSLNKLLHVRTKPGTTKHKVVALLREKLLNIAPSKYKENLIKKMYNDLKQLDQETLEKIKEEYILTEKENKKVAEVLDVFITKNKNK